MDAIYDFLVFRRMITPMVIQVLFVVGLLTSVFLGAWFISTGLIDHHTNQTLLGVGILVLGPVAIRLNLEALMVFFRINGSLDELRALARSAETQTPES